MIYFIASKKCVDSRALIFVSYLFNDIMYDASSFAEHFFFLQCVMSIYTRKSSMTKKLTDFYASLFLLPYAVKVRRKF